MAVPDGGCFVNHSRGTRRAMSANTAPVDRLLITAVVDRLIYGDPDTFSADDARTLLDALPRKRVPWIEIGAKGKVSGGSARATPPASATSRSRTSGHENSTSAPRRTPIRAPASGSCCATIAGAARMWRSSKSWRTRWTKAAARGCATGRTARRCGMDIRVVRNVRLLFSVFILQLPGWRPWKQPA